MTRDEAIEMLKSKMDGHTDTSYEWAETVRMAIKALKQQTCEDAVSREAVLGLFAQNADAVRPYSKTWEEVKALPSVNPQPKTGHWIFDEILDKHYYCSECKSMGVDYWDFCPYCGAKMVELRESEVEE